MKDEYEAEEEEKNSDSDDDIIMQEEDSSENFGKILAFPPISHDKMTAAEGRLDQIYYFIS